MITIASYNIKGGVGKTATAVNLSYLAARHGAETLLWDLDPQGAASFYFRVRPHVKGGLRRLFRRKGRLESAVKATDFRRLDLVPADFSYRNMDLFLEHSRNPAQQLRKLLNRQNLRLESVQVESESGGRRRHGRIIPAGVHPLVHTPPGAPRPAFVPRAAPATLRWPGRGRTRISPWSAPSRPAGSRPAGRTRAGLPEGRPRCAAVREGRPDRDSAGGLVRHERVLHGSDSGEHDGGGGVGDDDAGHGRR